LSPVIHRFIFTSSYYLPDENGDDTAKVLSNRFDLFRLGQDREFFQLLRSKNRELQYGVKESEVFTVKVLRAYVRQLKTFYGLPQDG